MIHSLRLLLVAALVGTGSNAWAAATPAVVKVNQAKVRAQPSSHSEVLTHLKQGDTVTVLGEQVNPGASAGEPRRWARIEMPEHVPVWLAANLIDPKSKKVKVERINLRAGPGKNFSPLGQMTKGTVVSEIRSEDGWMQIEAPAGCIAYMAAELLGPGSPRAAASPSPPPSHRPGPTPPPPSSERSRPPNVTPTSAASTPVAFSPDGTRLASPNVAATSAASTSPPNSINPKPQGRSAAPVPQPIESVATPQASAPENPVVPPPPALTRETAPHEPAPYNSVNLARPVSSSAGSQRPVSIIEMQKEPGPRVVNREGVIGETWSVRAPSYLELNSFRRREGLLNFLFADDPKIHLEPYRNKHVVLTGEEWVDARWPKTPVLRVQKIEALDY